MHRQFFHIGTDHRSVDDSDANLFLANGFVRLRNRICIDHVVQAACRFPDRRQELFVVCENQDVDGAGADVGSGGDFVRVQRGHAPGAIRDDCRTVLGRFHDDVLADGLVRARCRVVGRFREGNKACLTRRVVNQAFQ